MDNLQFQLGKFLTMISILLELDQTVVLFFFAGQAMKPTASFTTSLLDSLKRVYLTKVSKLLYLHLESISHHNTLT